MILLPMVASAFDFNVDGIYYSITSISDHTVQVASGDSKYSGDIIIPNKVTYKGVDFLVNGIQAGRCTGSYGGYSSLSFEDGAFTSSAITSVVIPSSITEIGTGTFAQCRSLKSVSLPNTLKNISGRGAFYGTSRLNEIILPDALETIGNEAFWGSGITSLTIGSNIQSFGYCAFRDCSNLKVINIPSIAAWCQIANGESKTNPLYYAKALTLNGEVITDLVIDSSINKISDYSFYGYEGLNSISFDNGISSIGNYAFMGCTGLKELVFPEGLTSIGNNAFDGCQSIKRIKFSSTVNYIGFSAFNDCNNIEQIESSIMEPTENYAFTNSTYMFTTLYVPMGTSSMYKNTSGWKNFSTIIEKEDLGKKPDMLDGHEYVDLGLPSGKCWATMNYGATSPEGYGSYLEWSSNSIISSNWGSGWTTPSLQDIRELENNCTWTWGQKNGHSGYTVKGKNGNSIFLPASGYMMMGQSSAGKVDQWVYYWTSTKSGEMAYIIMSTATDVWYGEMNTVYTQLPIRPITKENHSTVVQKCETPIISYINGKLTFACSTEGATCQYSITDSDIKVGSGNEVQLSVTYNISVYATKSGYENSETANATLCWIDQQPKVEGDINGIANVPAKALLIKNNGGQLTIEGIDDGQAVELYSLNGEKRGSAIGKNGVACIDTNVRPGSIVVVKMGEKSVKVIVK